MSSQAIRSQGTQIQRGATSVVPPQTISGITASGSVATATTSTAHGLQSGAIVTLSGATPSAYNGTYAITVLSPTTFSYTTASAPGGVATVVGAYTAQSVTFSTVEEASDIKLGGVSVSAIDVTHLLSTSKEFIAGLKDNGTCDLSANFINGAIQTLMRNDMNNGVTSPYKILISAGLTTVSIAFSGFLMKYAGPEAKVDGKLEIQMSIKITGDIAITQQ